MYTYQLVYYKDSVLFVLCIRRVLASLILVRKTFIFQSQLAIYILANEDANKNQNTQWLNIVQQAIISDRVIINQY